VEGVGGQPALYPCGRVQQLYQVTT
jgi:hypothetical protein